MFGEKSLSEPWIGVTRFALFNPSPPEGCMWVQSRLTKEQITIRPRNIWPDEWSNMSLGPLHSAINEWAEGKPKLDATREKCGIYSILDDDADFEEIKSEEHGK